MPARYLRLSFQVEPECEELLTAALWERGTVGVELCSATRSAIAYFPVGADFAEVSWEGYGARLLASEPFSDRDWLADYRRRAQPIGVGSRLVVDPGEPGDEVPPAAGVELLRLPARTAFGTGSHASTRLAVELMESLELAGMRVLDVGYGSGILSFAALLGGAAWVAGVEIDLQAALVGAQNRGLNRLAPGWVAGGVGTLGPAADFDLALVNVLPERIADDLGAIRGLLGAGGQAIFSGLVEKSVDSAVERLSAAGFVLRERRCEGEWTAVRVAAGEGAGA